MEPGSNGKKIPVGRAFIIQSGDSSRPLQAAIHAIQCVHTDGSLPTIPIFRNEDMHKEGSYQSTSFPCISVSNCSPRPELIVLHEIGHFIDHHGLGNGDFFASEADEYLLSGWRKAVNNSNAVKILKARLDNKTIEVQDINGVPTVHEIKRDYIQYLLLYSELFARSYAQFIILRNPNEQLRQQLDSMRRLPFSSIYPAYWEEDDFTSIADELVNVFEGQEWLS